MPVEQSAQDTRAVHRYRLRPILACVAGLALLLLLGGCTPSKEAIQRDPFLAELYNAQQQSSPHQIQQTFDVGNTEWTIVGAHAARKLRLSDSHLLTSAHGMFVIIDFTFQNQSDQAQKAPLAMIQIQDVRGKKYAADKEITTAYAQASQMTNFFGTTFQLDKTYRCVVVFDIPDNIGRLSLAFQSFPESGSGIGF